MPETLRQLTFDDLSGPPPRQRAPEKPSAPAPPLLPATVPRGYILERSSRRKSSIHISVLPDLSVRVVAPIRLAKSQIDAIVQQREAWIARQRETVSAAQQARVERAWVSGEMLPHLDEPLELRVRPVAGQKIVKANRKDSYLDVWVPAGLQTTEPIKRIVHKWYGLEAQHVFAQRVLHYSARLGVQPFQVLVRNQSSRWGSCASDGSLRFCWRLILAPQRILDYVVAHEVSHLRHHHHQPSFWSCVESLLPDYRERVAELKRDGDSYRL